MRIVGGCEFPDGMDELHCHLWMFGQAGLVDPLTGISNGIEISPEQRYGHLKSAIDLAFNCEGSIRRVVWNEWTERMLRKAVGDWSKKRFLGVAGCSSSGKSDGFALFGLMSYWSRPSDTYVLVMSTTKAGARMRVWKSMTQFWAQAERKGCPGKLLDSIGKIKGINELGKLTNNSGVELLAAGRSDAGEACNTILGVKNPNILLIADEFTDLGEGILKTASENLTVNDQVFFAGLANPNLLTDAFAELCEPKDGWKSVTEADEEWPTKLGECIRFDAERSPRIVEPDGERYFWQPNRKYCDDIAEKRGGVKSRGYFRFVKAFWCPEGSLNNIYSEVELMNNGALVLEAPEWDESPVALGGLDPSFSRMGDRSSAGIAFLGKVGGVARLHLAHLRTIEDNVNDKEVALTHQVARQWKDLCLDWGVSPHRAVVDGTGAGIPFGHVVDMEWSAAVHKVNFGGKPSGRTVVFRAENCEYFNKNAELWIQPKEYVRGGQISGITTELMAELVTREYHKNESRAIRVDSKEDHRKKNNNQSPDLADVFLLLVDRAIATGVFKSQEIGKVSKTLNSGWKRVKSSKILTSVCGRRLR